MRFFAAAAILALVPLAALAATPEAAPVAALDTALIATMKAGSANTGYQQRYNTLDPVVDSSFDLPVITQNSVGFLWNTLPAAQQQQLAALMEQFTVASYVSQFNSFGGEKILLLPAEKLLGAKRIIQTQIVPSDGSAPTEIDYVVGEDQNGWQITDVLLNGTISQVAIHASDFSSLVTSGDATQLIAALKSKIAALASGTTDSSGQ
jgi:phospholipid transport system substrate-binding protein